MLPCDALTQALVHEFMRKYIHFPSRYVCIHTYHKYVVTCGLARRDSMANDANDFPAINLLKCEDDGDTRVRIADFRSNDGFPHRETLVGNIHTERHTYTHSDILYCIHTAFVSLQCWWWLCQRRFTYIFHFGNEDTCSMRALGICIEQEDTTLLLLLLLR